MKLQKFHAAKITCLKVDEVPAPASTRFKSESFPRREKASTPFEFIQPTINSTETDFKKMILKINENKGPAEKTIANQMSHTIDFIAKFIIYDDYLAALTEKEKKRRR